jgi:ABC-type transporter Mla subunit MlaD
MYDAFDMDLDEARQTRDEFHERMQQFQQFARVLQATLSAIQASVYGNFAAALIAALQAAIKRAMETANYCDDFAKTMQRNIEQVEQTEKTSEGLIRSING